MNRVVCFLPLNLIQTTACSRTCLVFAVPPADDAEGASIQAPKPDEAGYVLMRIAFFVHANILYLVFFGLFDQ
jgi:hypothetical protein